MQNQGGRCGTARTQIIKHGGRLFKKERQIIFNACRGHTIADVFVNAAFGRVAIEQFTPAASELGARRFVHGKLTARQQAHLGHRIQAALGVGVEGANGINFVVKQIDPIGHQRAHGKQIDQATAHRIFAGADHLAHVAVSRQGKLGFELGFVQFLFGLEVKRVASQKRRRCQAIQSGGGRNEHQVGAFGFVTLVNAPQRGQAFTDEVLMGREGVVGQRFPIGKNGAAQVWCKESHLVHEALCVSGIRSDHGCEAALGFFALGQLGQ